MANKEGKQFEESLEQSVKSLDPKMFFLRIKDTFIPPSLRMKVPVSKNKYDCIIYDQNVLFAVELKSTQNKSVSFSESIIKQHQIDNLIAADTYDGVIAGFIFNFRECNNKTYFVHIRDFVKYKATAESNPTVNPYMSKINKSSIPIDICEEIGIEIKNYKKRVKYHYHMRIFTTEAIKRYEK